MGAVRSGCDPAHKMFCLCFDCLSSEVLSTPYPLLAFPRRCPCLRLGYTLIRIVSWSRGGVGTSLVSCLFLRVGIVLRYLVWSNSLASSTLQYHEDVQPYFTLFILEKKSARVSCTSDASMRIRYKRNCYTMSACFASKPDVAWQAFVRQTYPIRSTNRVDALTHPVSAPKATRTVGAPRATSPD